MAGSQSPARPCKGHAGTDLPQPLAVVEKQESNFGKLLPVAELIPEMARLGFFKGRFCTMTKEEELLTTVTVLLVFTRS